MKTKLTKEQSEYLAEKLYELKGKDAGYLAVNDNYELKVKDFQDIINQCTEQEFPSFIFKNVRIEKLNDKVWLDFTGYDGSASFTYDEFKQFADGIVAAKTWIEKNEKDS